MNSGATIRFGPLGFCIYCKRRDLPEGLKRFTNEHVLPLSLGGTTLLTEASCKTCEGIINSGFETDISKHVMGDVRHKHGVRSRRHRRGQPTRTTKVVKSKWGGSFEVPLADYPVAFMIYDFGTATLLTGGPDESVDGNGWWEAKVMTEDQTGEATARFKEKYPDWDETVSGYIWPHKWARLAAKVAYGIAICQLGFDAFDEAITPIILGEEELWSRRVGGGREGYRNQAPVDPGFSFKLVPIVGSQFHLVMDHRMFQGEDNPKYHVVLGTIDFENPVHLARFEEARSQGLWKIVPATN